MNFLFPFVVLTVFALCFADPAQKDVVKSSDPAKQAIPSKSVQEATDNKAAKKNETVAVVTSDAKKDPPPKKLLSLAKPVNNSAEQHAQKRAEAKLTAKKRAEERRKTAQERRAKISAKQAERKAEWARKRAEQKKHQNAKADKE